MVYNENISCLRLQWVAERYSREYWRDVQMRVCERIIFQKALLTRCLLWQSVSQQASQHSSTTQPAMARLSETATTHGVYRRRRLQGFHSQSTKRSVQLYSSDSCEPVLRLGLADMAYCQRPNYGLLFSFFILLLYGK